MIQKMIILPFIKVTKLEISLKNIYMPVVKQVSTQIIGYSMFVIQNIIYLTNWSAPRFLIVIIISLKFVESPIQINLRWTVKQFSMIKLK